MNEAQPMPDGPGPEPVDPEELEQRVIEVLKDTFDPEIPVNIYDLGMVYNVEADASGNVEVRMTLTSPACPVAASLPGEVEARIREIDSVRSVTVNLVWDPPWDKDMMSMAARLTLGL